MPVPGKIVIGGLLACCVKTITDFITRNGNPNSEHVYIYLPCKYCKDGVAVFEKGIWRWHRNHVRDAA